MNINDTPEQAAFRQEIREWVRTSVPPHLKGLAQGIVQGPGLNRRAWRELNETMEQKGWLAPHWPKKHGGAGLDVPQLVIFFEEMTAAGIPIKRTTGLDMLGPVLIRYGNAAQQRRFLPPTLRDEIIWAQGYSEPQAGSDLASLSLRAEVVEDGFILTGQKIRTSKAHEADWIFLLARTDPAPARKQQGISFLLLDMRTEGIEVRPIRTMDGFSHFCETFFDTVFVPRENLVGDLHQGWTMAKALLGHERFTHPTAHPFVIGNFIANLKTTARHTPAEDGVLWDDVALRRRVAAMEMDVDCLRTTQYRALTRIEKGEAPGPETMLFKQFGAELTQRIISLEQEMAGPLGTYWDDTPLADGVGHLARHATNIRAASIRGGTTEVQRNIIAKRVLNLPD